MPTLLNVLTPDDYAQAAAQLADALDDGTHEPAAALIDRVLHAYVALAVGKRITDYGATTLTGQYAIAQRVAEQAGAGISTASVQNILNELAQEGAQGLIDVRVASPRKWNDQYVAAYAESHRTFAEAHPEVTNPLKALEKGTQDFFDAVRSTVNSALKGLGINLPLETIVMLAVVLVLYLVVSSARAQTR